MNIFPNNYNNEREREFLKEKERDEWVVRWFTNTPITKNYVMQQVAFSSLFHLRFLCSYIRNMSMGLRERGMSMYAWVVEVYVSLGRLLQGT